MGFACVGTVSLRIDIVSTSEFRAIDMLVLMIPDDYEELGEA